MLVRTQKGIPAVRGARTLQRFIWGSRTRPPAVPTGAGWKLFAYAALTGILTGQSYTFGPELRVNDDPPASCLNATLAPGQHLLSARGDTVYLVWRNDRDSSPGIYFARSDDAGRSFTANVQVDRLSGQGRLPAMCVDDQGSIHAAWLGISDDIYYARSADGGRTFRTPVRVGDAGFGYISMAASRDGQRVYVAHHKSVGAYSRILLARSTDAGASFLRPETRVNADTFLDMLNQTIAVFDDTIVLMAWNNGTGSVYGQHVYFARSTDAGATFTGERIISDTARSSEQVTPSIAIDAQGWVYALWHIADSAGIGLQVSVSEDTGRTFGTPRRIPRVSGGQEPSIWATSAGKLFIAYRSWRVPNPDDIRFIHSPDRGRTFQNPVNPSRSGNTVEEKYPTVAANENGRAFVAWTDNRNDTTHFNSDIYFATGSNSAIEEPVTDALTGPYLRVAPNPAGRSVTIDCGVPGRGETSIKVLDLAGRVVRSLAVRGSSGAGRITARWDGRDEQARAVVPGVYFVALSVGSCRLARQVQLLGEPARTRQEQVGTIP